MGGVHADKYRSVHTYMYMYVGSVRPFYSHINEAHVSVCISLSASKAVCTHTECMHGGESAHHNIMCAVMSASWIAGFVVLLQLSEFISE